MSADKYPNIFSRQMEAIVYICILRELEIKCWALPIEGLRAKRAYIEFLTDFHFLQDRANFWQTDLF